MIFFTPHRCSLRQAPATLVAVLIALTTVAAAQSLEEWLDEDAFLQGLIELELPEVLEHYMQTHPPADAVQEARYRIAAARLRLRRSADDPAARLAQLEQILDIRRTLIDEQPDHPRRAIWLADQAADLFFEMLPTDASGLTTLFGAPSPAQRRRAQRVAREMNDLTSQAELEIQRAILEIESTPGFRDDEALQMQRRRLSYDERARRIPFLRGVAAFLHAELNVLGQFDRRSLYELSVGLLQPLLSEFNGSLANRARLYCGFALGRLGRFDEAKELFRRVATDETSRPSDVFAARMAGVLSLAERDGPAAALRQGLDQVEPKYAGDENLFYRVLIADQRFLLKREIALRQSGEERREGMQEAFDAYFNLLNRPGAIPRATMRAIVFSKLAGAADDETPLEDLPAIVTVARAERLAQDGARRVEAIELLETALKRDDLEEREQAAALFALGKALHASDRKRAAAERFVQLAREHPTDAEAARAVEYAASIAADLHQRRPEDADVRRFLRETLALLLQRYPTLPTVDRWRYVAARAAMREGDFAEAVERLTQIAPDAAQWPDAQFMHVNALRKWAETPVVDAERRRLNQEVLDTAERAVQALTAAADDATPPRRSDLHYYIAFLGVFRAQALLDLHRPDDALEALADLESRPGADNAVLAAALRVRIRAYEEMGRPEDAYSQVERFLQAAPDQAGPVIDAMLASVLHEVESMLDETRDEEAQERASRGAVPLAELMERWLVGANLDAALRRAMLHRAADAYRLAGRFGQALLLYDRVLRDRPGAVEALFGRAECLFGLDDQKLAEAMDIYRRIAAGGTELGPGYYWQSQLRMLQILDRVQKNTDRILPRIKRLRKQDPDLGGRRYRRGFQRLEGKYA